MSEQNKVLERRLIEQVWNEGNLSVADEVVARDYTGRQSRGETRGPDGFKQYFAMLRGAFPDIHFTIEDQIAEGDRVVTRWTAHATHQGPFQGIPPTGNPGVVTGITINRIANGKLVEGWTNLDELGLLQQLGVIPAPEPVG
ncbi:MAG TPA: ester cyclase [Thermomicrobiales bacterium]|nr:ester cyclase [Thermomicrobiales bacterium]